MSKGEETRKKILRSALSLFSTKGYEQTSIRDIAIEVNIKAPSIYAYFSGKEELFISVSEFAMKDYINFVQNHSFIMENQSIEKNLYTLMKSLNDYFFENELGHFINRYFIVPSEQFKEKLVQLCLECEEEIKKVLLKILNPEAEKFISIDLILVAFFCNLDGMLLYMVNYSREHYETRLKQMWQVFWRGIQK
ncbi:TetR/AcrR family transcriptional regulator [Bacillales bacterium AN1005]|uniref:TetR/AcrR family transcriptional regulator n=1 Tax=Niallia taxi TaxID=2499688 RepID=UPI0021A76935|nr:TetR/AcrR family transcriptional regulator [Niallia taxi]MCT2347163.1 TetR/AcrR family transcriptional regulator [Niallia taxi]